MIYQFVIFYIPTPEEIKKGSKPYILAGPTTILSSDTSSATILAARQIPEKYIEKLENVEIAVRPF